MCVNTTRESKGITIKEQLIKRGFQQVQNYGAKITILRQYSDFKDDIGSLSDWCKEHSSVTEENDRDLTKKVQELCFETLASKLESSGNFVMLKVSPEDPNEDSTEWNESFDKFKKDYEANSTWKASNNWNNTLRLEDFKKQCKENGRKPLINENESLFREVERYCTRRLNFTNQNSWSIRT